MAEVIERLSSIETTLGAIQNTLAAQNGWNEKTAQERAHHYTESVRQMTEISLEVRGIKIDSQKYQDDCTAERLRHDKAIQAHEIKLSNIAAVSGYRATLISIFISLCAAVGAWAFLIPHKGG